MGILLLGTKGRVIALNIEQMFYIVKWESLQAHCQMDAAHGPTHAFDIEERLHR
jgi:hypothetical protein